MPFAFVAGLRVAVLFGSLLSFFTSLSKSCASFAALLSFLGATFFAPFSLI
jgi:hypothetical protein